MGKISTAYDAIITLVEATLPNYQRLPNVYSLEENNQLYKEKGYALGLTEGGINTELLATCKRASWQQAFVLVLINQVTATDHNTALLSSIDKALIEDAYKIFKAVESDIQFNETVTKAIVTDNTGIEVLEDEGNIKKFLITESIILVDFFDTL